MSLANYEPLFLKYRPQTLGELVGQESVKETLKNAIETKKLVHAYLFTGPRGCGKTSSARILAKSLNCEQGPTVSPCGKCASCLGIANSTSLDVTEIDAASHGNVDDARTLIEKVNFASISGSYKIYIIDEVHMLSTAAFNALLKVFEEPPEKVVFILATTEEDKVLPTIVSRCQKFNFKHIALNDAVKRLRYVADQESIKINDDALELIAKRADGAMRDALATLDQLSVFNEELTKDKVLDLVGGIKIEDLKALTESLAKRDSKTLLEKLDNLLASGKESNVVCKELIAYLLELLETGLGDFTEDFDNAELVQIIETLSDLEYRIKTSTQSKNLLRAALLKLVHRQDILVAKDIMKRLEALEQGAVPMRATNAPAPARPAPRPESAPAKPAISKPEPVGPEPVASPAPTQPVASSSEASADSASQEFFDYLSPACKGLCVSSKVQLKEVNGDKASLQMPTKFKFLKTKIEAKSEEILSAINKSGDESATSLEVQLSDEMLQAEPVSQSKFVGKPMPEAPKEQAEETSQEEAAPNPSQNYNPKLTEVANMAISTFNGKEI